MTQKSITRRPNYSPLPYSKGYSEGMAYSIKMRERDIEEPVNPYPEDSIDHNGFLEGFLAGIVVSNYHES